jgi:hypothetical protein
MADKTLGSSKWSINEMTIRHKCGVVVLSRGQASWACVNTKVEKFGDGTTFAQNSVDLLFVLCRYEIVMMMMMFLCPTMYSSI